MRDKVEKVLAEIKPMLQADGGDVELIDVTDNGVVKVKLTGACGSCPMSSVSEEKTWKPKYRALRWARTAPAYRRLRFKRIDGERSNGGSTEGASGISQDGGEAERPRGDVAGLKPGVP